MSIYKKLATTFLATLVGCAGAPHKVADSAAADNDAPVDKLKQIETVVVIYAENRSFDHLFGHYPGAEGLDFATSEQKTQLDHDGTKLSSLPGVYLNGKLQENYAQHLPNGPFAADQPPVNRKISDITVSPIHSFYVAKQQINGGKNNQFVADTNVGAWVMATYDGSQLKTWKWAREYTLADHFFAGVFGGSFPNHQWLICACIPRDTNAPATLRAQLDENGRLKAAKDSKPSVMDGPPHWLNGRIGADGFVTDNADPPWQPSRYGAPTGADRDGTDPAKYPLPPQTAKTIGDTLSAKGVSWAWYASGYNAALADGRQDASAPRKVIYNYSSGALSFQTHHQPFNYYARFAPGTKDRVEHLKDGEDFLQAIDKGNLPQVSFYKPVGLNNMHSASSTIALGDVELDAVLTRLKASPQWPKMAVIVTYDENGGYWDHMSPPSGPGWGDFWGPGTRVPTLIVSPFARRGYVDKTVYDTTSIIKFLTRRFGLESIAGVREKMGDLSAAFAFN